MEQLQQATPKQLVLGLLVCLGALTIARDIQRMMDTLRFAEQTREEIEELPTTEEEHS